MTICHSHTTWSTLIGPRCICTYCAVCVWRWRCCWLCCVCVCVCIGGAAVDPGAFSSSLEAVGDAQAQHRVGATTRRRARTRPVRVDRARPTADPVWSALRPTGIRRVAQPQSAGRAQPATEYWRCHGSEPTDAVASYGCSNSPTIRFTPHTGQWTISAVYFSYG